MQLLSLELPDAPEPVEALSRLLGRPGPVLLESAGSAGRYSLLGSDPLFTLTTDRDGTRIRRSRTRGEDALLERFPDPFAALAWILQRLEMPLPPPGVPFAGGVVGYLGYEAGDSLERLPEPPPDDVGMPGAWFGVYESMILWDRQEGRCRAVASVLPGRSPEEVSRRLDRLVELAMDPGAPAPTRDHGTKGGANEPGFGEGAPKAAPHSSVSEAGYKEDVERIRDYIRAGDLFQANLTRRITVPTELTGMELYRRLRAESPADYCAYLRTGEGEVASISPELFLSARGGRVRSRPIKGTAARGATKREDRGLREALAKSEKDRAENVMIVDLIRNDLSRVCRPGSVRVPGLARLETHPTVHHLVSTVTGALSPGTGPVDLLSAAFPGGSITGAPKIRAIEVLRELEPVRRGVYTGALGIVSFHGDLDLSIAIRTAVLKGGLAHYGTGGGITLSSEPDAEWMESEVKAGAFLRALGVESAHVPDPPSR